MKYKYKRYVSDPVLLRTDFCCAYCGKDLLADLDTFLTLVHDHFLPRAAGGRNGPENLVASCAACDRIKAGSIVPSLAVARAAIAQQRRNRAEWYERIRQAVRV